MSGSPWEFGLAWASLVSLCDGFGVVENTGLEGGGEGGASTQAETRSDLAGRERHAQVVLGPYQPKAVTGEEPVMAFGVRW